jgi:hypothetical protein
MHCRCRTQSCNECILYADRGMGLRFQPWRWVPQLLSDDRKSNRGRQAFLPLAALTTAEKRRWVNFWTGAKVEGTEQAAECVSRLIDPALRDVAMQSSLRRVAHCRNRPDCLSWFAGVRPLNESLSVSPNRPRDSSSRPSCIDQLFGPPRCIGRVGRKCLEGFYPLADLFRDMDLFLEASSGTFF